jgi:putative addiction module component (TIGR02574 family)
MKVNMSKTAEKMKTKLAGLSIEDRAELAYYLLHTLDDDDESESAIQKAWETELDRRWARIESGEAKGIPAKKAIAQAREKLK